MPLIEATAMTNSTGNLNSTNSSMLMNITLNNVSVNNTLGTNSTGIMNESVNRTGMNSTENSTNIMNSNQSIVNITQEGRKENQCEVYPLIEIAKETYNYSETIVFQNKVINRSRRFIIEYWVEDGEGNKVKSPVKTANTNKKQFTPKFDSGEMSLWIKNRIIDLDCNNTVENPGAAKQVYITNPDYMEPVEEIDAQVSVKVPVKRIIKNNRVNKTVREEPQIIQPITDPVKKPGAPKNGTGKESNKEIQIPSYTAYTGESVINSDISPEKQSEPIYVGSAKKAKSYGMYGFIGVVLMGMVGVIRKQW